MIASDERIVKTHVGSLPRPQELRRALMSGASHAPEGTFAAQVEAAVGDAVDRQVAAGIDIVSDGEMGKPGFIISSPTASRASASSPVRLARRWRCPRPARPSRRHSVRPPRHRGGRSGRRRARGRARGGHSGRIEYAHPERLGRELSTLRAALAGRTVAWAFVQSASPFLAAAMRLDHYADFDELFTALVPAFAAEYRRIVEGCSHQLPFNEWPTAKPMPDLNQ